MKKCFFVFIIIWIIFCPPCIAGHQNCTSAKVVCSINDQPSEGQICNSGCSGNNNLANGTNSCFSGGLTRWGFYMFTIQQSGTLTLTITPSGGFFGTDDYNWAIFDVSDGCGNLGNALRCSAANTNGNATGLNTTATDSSEGSGGDGWCQFLNVVCGHTYVIVLDVPNNGSSGFDMNFGGTCLFGAPQTPFNAVPATVCANQPVSFSIDTTACYVSNPFISYNWDFGPNATPQTYTGLTPPAVTFSANGPQNITLTTEFATNGGSCNSATSQVVTVSSTPPVSTFSVSAPACTNNTVTITYTGNSAASANYTWNFDGGAIISGSGQGPHTVSWSTPGIKNVTLDVSDCSSTSPTTTISVNVTTSPTSVFTVSSPVCLNDNSTITYSGTGTGSDTYSWNFDTGNIVSGTGQGPYSVYWTTSGTKNITLTVTDANGCSSAAGAANATVNPLPVANAGADVAFCSGTATTLGAASSSGYTYLWMPSSGLSDNDTSSPTVIITNNNLTDSVVNYVLSATSNGCTATDTVQVTVHPLPTSDFTTTVGTVCVDENLIIQYIGNADTATATFIWDFDNGNILFNSGQTYQVAWDTSGQKNITLTVLQNNCLSTQEKVVVTVNPPNANAGPDVSFCSGNTVPIGMQSTPSYTYSWSPATGLSNSTIAYPILTLNNITQSPVNVDYILTTSFAGCSHTDTVTVTVNPEPVSSAGPDILNFCSGNSALIGTFGNSDYTYSWYPTTGLNSATVSSPTVTLTNSSSTPFVQTYTVTTTFATYGCMANDAMSITVYQIPTSSFSAPDSVCINEIATVTYTGNATTNASYQWNFGGGNALPGAGQGPHTVYYTDSGNVTISLNVTEICSSATAYSQNVYVKPFPVSNAGIDVAYCSGNTAPIGTTTSPGYAYAWSPGAGLNDSAISNPTVNSANNSQIPLITNYVVTTALNGCISADTVKVTVYQAPTSTFNLPSPSQLCGTENAIISYTGNATPSATYNWNFGGGIIISGSGQGAYTVKWQTTSIKYISLWITENGCTSDTTVDSIMVYPVPVFSAGNDFTVCSGNSFVLGGTTQNCQVCSYQWFPSDSLSSDTVSNPTFKWITASSPQKIDSLQYIVTVSANNCIASDTVQVTVIPYPDITFTSPDFTQCHTGNNFSFFSSGDYLSSATFNWNFGNNANPSNSVLQHPQNISFQFQGTYPVKLTVSQFGCTDVFSDTVIVYPMPTENAKPDTTSGCEPLLIKFYTANNSNLTYSWSFGDNNTSALPKPQHTFNDEGTYDVYLKITSFNGCDSTFLVSQITVNPTPDAAFSFSPQEITNLNPVVNFLDASTQPIITWKWNFGDGAVSSVQNPSHFFSDTGTYITTLVVANNNYCIDTITDTIVVLPSYNFFIPSAFSPNGDGTNDVFMPIAIGIDYSDFEMLIYNRWGELIFVTQSANVPWDGILDGKQAPADVYVWYVHLRDVFRKQHRYVGHVSVVR